MRIMCEGGGKRMVEVNSTRYAWFAWRLRLSHDRQSALLVIRSTPAGMCPESLLSWLSPSSGFRTCPPVNALNAQRKPTPHRRKHPTFKGGHMTCVPFAHQAIISARLSKQSHRNFLIPPFAEHVTCCAFHSVGSSPPHLNHLPPSPNLAHNRSQGPAKCIRYADITL